MSACFEVFVECIVCFGEFEEVSSSFQLVLLTLEASLNTKKLKRTCTKRFLHSDTLSY